MISAEARREITRQLTEKLLASTKDPGLKALIIKQAKIAEDRQDSMRALVDTALGTLLAPLDTKPEEWDLATVSMPVMAALKQLAILLPRLKEFQLADEHELEAITAAEKLKRVVTSVLVKKGSLLCSK